MPRSSPLCAPARAGERCTWAEWALGVLFIAFGAVVNAIYLALGTDYYADFAEASPFPFVRDTWQSLVLPNQGLFITLLILFEAAVGALIISGGRRTQIGLIGLIGFHLGQLAFGGVLWPGHHHACRARAAPASRAPPIHYASC